MVEEVELWRQGEWVLEVIDEPPENIKESVVSVVDKAILKMMEKQNARV